MTNASTSRDEPDAGAGETAADLPRTYSFACFPAERIAILTGIFAGPAMAAILLLQYRGVFEVAQSSRGLSMAADAGSRLLPGLMVLLALALVVFGFLYLQYRAAARLVVDERGVRFERKPVLPFGWTARRVELPWAEITRTQFRRRISLSGLRPELLLEWSGGRLSLSVSDAWEEGGGSRPWFPKPPAGPGGWRSHPLVQHCLENAPGVSG